MIASALQRRCGARRRAGSNWMRSAMHPASFIAALDRRVFSRRRLSGGTEKHKENAMSVSMLEAKAHELIGQLGPNKLAVIVQLMEVLIHDDEDSDTSVPPRPTRQQRLTSGANTTR